MTGVPMTTLFLSYARGDDEPFVARLYRDLCAREFSANTTAAPPSPRPSPRWGEGDRLSPMRWPHRAALARAIPFSPAGRRCPKGG
jgi:hypothetical protein